MLSPGVRGCAASGASAASAIPANAASARRDMRRSGRVAGTACIASPGAASAVALAQRCGADDVASVTMTKPAPPRLDVHRLSLDEAASHLLEECRTIVPGVQAVFGFQLIAVFNQGFGEKLAPAE